MDAYQDQFFLSVSTTIQEDVGLIRILCLLTLFLMCNPIPARGKSS